MRDLQTVFDVIERVPTPDLWDRVQLRADHLPSGGLELPAPRRGTRQRIIAGAVAVAVFALVVALALAAVGGRDPIPASPRPAALTISFSTGHPVEMIIDGQHIAGEMRNGTNVMSNHPEPDIRVHYQFFPDQMPAVPAGSLLTVEGVVDSRGWIDECCEYGRNGPVRLSGLDLAGSPALPDASGKYFVELSVHIIGATGQGAPGDDPFTFLFPVRVVPAS